MTSSPHLVRCSNLVVLLLTLSALPLQAQPTSAPFNDHQNMMDQLGIKKNAARRKSEQARHLQRGHG
jgi:hypothetical protein